MPSIPWPAGCTPRSMRASPLVAARFTRAGSGRQAPGRRRVLRPGRSRRRGLSPARPRGRRARARAARCLSMTRIDSPSARSTARQAKISARISGARPFGGLVEDQQAGLVISARPIASICCSPPESSLPRLRRRSARRGKRRYTRSSVQRGWPRREAAVATRFSSHAQRREHLASLRDQADAGLGDAMRRRAGRGARRRTRRRRRSAGSRPMMARTVVVLPMPLRPISATTSPSPTARSTPNRTCALP